MIYENFVIFSCLLGLTMTFPVDQESSIVIKTKSELIPEKKEVANVVKSPKQDDNDGDTDGAGGLDGIGNNLEQIVSGAVSGNLGSIFGGSTGFIGDGDTQQAVSGLLTQVYNPLNKVVQSSLTQLTGGGTAGTTQPSAATTAKKRAATSDEDDDDDDDSK